MTKHATQRRARPTRAIIPGQRAIQRMMLLRTDDHWCRPGLVYRLWPDGRLREVLDPLTRRPVDR